jgi:glycosyltransferase involved in cell wall biosynthesis
MKPTIAFLIPSLETGGAERQLIALAHGLDKSRWAVKVIAGSPGSGQPEWTVPEEMRLPVDISLRPGLRAALKRALERNNVALLQAHLVSAQAKACWVRATGWRGRLVIGVGDSKPVWDVRSPREALSTATVFGCSRWVDQYVFNSERGVRAKRRLVPIEKQTVIPNGIDVDRFRPDPDARARLRQIADVPRSSLVVGTVANVTSYKDYPNLIAAARLVLDERPDVHFVSIGDDRTPFAKRVAGETRRMGVANRVRFLGPRTDVEQLVPGFDVVCSSSNSSEGQSNAIAEAMACGVPPVVTDAGDSVLLVGDTGLDIPIRKPAKLAEALLHALSWTPEERAARGSRARRRIVERFSVERMVAAHDALYSHLLSRPMASGRVA